MDLVRVDTNSPGVGAAMGGVSVSATRRVRKRTPRAIQARSRQEKTLSVSVLFGLFRTYAYALLLCIEVCAVILNENGLRVHLLI